tara:strand:+ start:1695 stop:2261 length:567 start_codon:yes stop_codon:yes gene_type:complete
MKSTSYIDLYPISSSGGNGETSINNNGIFVSEPNGGVNPSNVRMGAFRIGQGFIPEPSPFATPPAEYLVVDLNQGGSNEDIRYSAVIVEGSLTIMSSSPSNPQNFSTYFFTKRFITDHLEDDNFGEGSSEFISTTPSNTTNSPDFLIGESNPFIISYNNTTKQVSFKYVTNGTSGTSFVVAKGIYTLI